jgi:hypothetical protein
VVGILVSLGIVAAGGYLVTGAAGPEMELLGAMLLVLGATFLFVNVYLHRKGFRMRRRR